MAGLELYRRRARSRGEDGVSNANIEWNCARETQLMTALPKLFRVFVIVAVTLTGTAFGVLTGPFYSLDYWWAGMIAGGGSGFFLAFLYLFALSKLPPRLHGGAAWTLGTLVAVGCGVLCTLLAHGVMWQLTGDSAGV